MHEGRQAVVAQLEPAVGNGAKDRIPLRAPSAALARGLEPLNENVALRESGDLTDDCCPRSDVEIATADPVDVVRNSYFIS
jgi:hypothetical protein